ncbi:MAG: rRNA pseudouridine synthase [Firmicutes bacterium]|nr:rRNA pseudouridine synthase [Bacillota bacterium]
MVGVAKKQRLDRILARMGVGSRREVKILVRAGRVSVNGEVVKNSAFEVHPEDRVAVDGQVLEYQEFYYLMLNKPAGYLTATKDQYAPTVMDLLPEYWQRRKVVPVGRLDKDTEGLLIFTNDGQLVHHLLSPRRRVAKTYFLRVDGEVTPEELEALAAGVVLDDGYRTLPAEVKLLKPGRAAELELTIYEGKFHQVKRMLRAVGKNVIYLQRRSMAGVKLDPKLKLGESRELWPEEIECLYRSGEGSLSKREM